MADMTVIYYTSNREKEPFEDKICQTLLKSKGDIPLVSVSQKPMSFGINICVGDVGVHQQNAYRQLLIGAEEAKTNFVCTAEADFLYAPEYFKFRPHNTKTFYVSRPCWILRSQRGKQRVAFRKSPSSDSPMVVGRKALIRRLQEMFVNQKNYWRDVAENDAADNPYLLHRDHVAVRSFEAGAGSLTFKTDENMHRGSPWLESTRTTDIPGWGSVRDLLEKYCG